MLKDVRTVRFIYKVISTVQTPLHRGQGSKHCNKYFCRFYKTFWYKPELYVTRAGKKRSRPGFQFELVRHAIMDHARGEGWRVLTHTTVECLAPPEALTGSSDIGNDPWPLTSPKLPLSQKNFNTIQKPSEANLISFFLISCLLIPHASMSAFYN